MTLFVFLFWLNSSNCQNENWNIDTSFFIRGEKVENVEFYLLESKKAYPLKYDGKTLYIDSGKRKEEKLNLLAVHKKHRVEFSISPKELFYIKIYFDNRWFGRENVPFKLKYLFKKVYLINQGFDYVEIVEKSRAEYDFVVRVEKHDSSRK